MEDGSNASATMIARRRPRLRRAPIATMIDQSAADRDADGPKVDPYRAVIFPNRVREQRVRRGKLKLLSFAATLPEIPYIRLSKIERGEVFARVDELVRIATALDLSPLELLADVDSPDFDLAAWFAPFAESSAGDDDAEARMAMLLAAAVRARRAAEPRLTAGVMDAEFDIPPVILSRIENAQKGLARWNEQTVASLCRLFDVADEAGLRAHLTDSYATGQLDPYLAAIASPEQRAARTRQRVAALRNELSERSPGGGGEGTRNGGGGSTPPSGGAARRMVPVMGAPLADGLIALVATGAEIEAPAVAGTRAFGVRVCRPTLGGGLPGQSTVIVDPDRFPAVGGLALVRDGEGHRLVTVTTERDGSMKGWSQNPQRDIPMDSLAPADVAAVVAAIFV